LAVAFVTKARNTASRRQSTRHSRLFLKTIPILDRKI